MQAARFGNTGGHAYLTILDQTNRKYAWPEGNQRQLSAESAFIAGWSSMSLDHMAAFGADWRILVRGKAVTVYRNGKMLKNMRWDGIRPIVID